MRSRLLVAVLVVLALGAHVRRATAVDSWCADDPVVAINGLPLDVQVQLPTADALTLRSTALTIVIPRNVTGQVVVNDVSAFPMTTVIAATAPPWFGRGMLPITIQVEVTAAITVPVQVVATQTPTGPALLPNQVSASGSANTTLVVPMNLAS
jgi:hypothetical protein